MSSQARGPAKLDVGAGGSPPGPDSTWEAETTFSKMDERLASMETKILNALELNHKLIQEQNQKMAEQEETIQQLQSAVDARFKELSSKVTGLSKGGALSNTKKKTPAVTKKESEDEGDEENPTLEKVEELMAIIEQKCIPYLEMCETTDNTINEKIIPALTKLEGDQDLGLSIKNLNEKIDTLLDGDTEANKLIETIIPNIEQIKQNVSNLEGGKSDAKTSEDISKIKSTLEKIYRNQKEESVSSVKEKVKDLGHDIGKVLRCSEDMKEYVKDIRDDLEENTKKVDEYSKRGLARGKVLDTIEKHVASKKKRGSDSDSSDDERVYNRGNDRSRSSRDGSREGGRIVRSSSNNSGISKTKEQQFESLLVQINGSIDILSERINKVCPSELIETTLLPSLAKIERHVGSLVGGNSGGGSSWTKLGPPTSDPSSGTKWTYDDTGKRREASDREDSRKDSRKKRRRRSGSSSNSESEGERDKKDNDIERQVATIGIAVNGLKEKIDMFVKTNKKSCKNVEDTTKTVLDRVGEMTLGVQVIAENLDNVNDVSKKIESLDGISTLMDRMAGVPKALDKLDNLTGMEERLAMLPQMERSVSNVQQLVTELVGRPVERMDGGRRGGDLQGEEMEDIQAQLKKMEADIPTKLCEFVSVVENLHSEMAKKVDKLSNKMMDRVGGGSNPLLMPKLDDILKRVKRLENLNSAFADNDIKMIGTLKSLEKTQKTEIVPLLQMGGMGGGGETPGTPGGSSEGRVSDVRLGALTGILSQIQPKLDDLYIRVLPTLEEIKSRQKDEIKSRQKDEEMENLREREDKDHIQKILDIVEDLREERPSGLDRRLSEGLGSGDMEGIVRLVRDVEQMIQENEGKMEQVLKALVDVRTCTAKEANFGRLEHKLEEAIHGGMGRIEPDTLNKIHNKINSILTSCSKEEKEMKKVLDGVNELRSNSSCDAKTLSQVNTALQGMKAAASSHDNKMTTAVSGLEEKIDNIFKGNGEDGESNCLDEILAKREEELLSSIEKMLTKMEDEMFDNVEKVVKQVGDNVTNRVGMTEDGINTDLNRIMDKLNNVSVKAPPKAPVKDAGNVKEEQEEMDDGNVDKVVTNLSSQMDDVHDLIAGVEERIVTALKDVKQAVSNHDKHVAGSINKVAVLQRKVVEEMSKLDVAAELLAIEGRLHNVIKEERENVADKLEGSGDGESSVKLDAMSSKIDKLAKNIARVKYLVDATDEESDGGGGGAKKVGPGRRSIKKDKADDGKDENVIDNAKMEALLSSFEKRQGDLFTEGCKTQDKALLELKKSLCEVTKKLGTLEEGVTSVNVCLEEDLTGTGDTLADIVKNVDNIKESILKQTSCLTEGLDKIDGKMAMSSALEKIEQRMATGLALDRMSGKILCKIENSSGLGGGGSGGGGGGSGGGIDEDSLRKIDKKINELKDPLGEVVKKIGELKEPMGEVVKNVKEINNAEGRIIKKISELSDLVATSSALEKTSNDVIDQLDKVLAGITEIPNEFGAQAAAMEENLCVNVVGAVRDAGKDNWTDLFNQMDHFEGRLAIVKRYCKYGRIRGGSKGGPDDGNDDGEEDVALETVVKDIQRVSDKLEDLSKAMENGVTAGNNSEQSPIKGSSREQLSMALLLTEIRKRADTDSVSKLHTDMFKSIHNVQRRLLEEQARLVTKLSEARLESKTPSYGTVLIESLNKVRQTQATILDGQDKSVIAQSDLNKVLSTVINAIEETHKLLDAKQNKGGGQMVGRLADLCDDLANAVTGLLSLQNQAACNNSTSLETLDELIKNCGEIPHIQVDESKDEGRKRTSQGGGRAGPPAKRRSLAPRGSTRISEKTEHGSEDQGDESGDESSADTPQRTGASKSNKLAVDKKTRRSGRIRASKDEEPNENTEKDSESAFGDDIEIVDEINSCPPMVYKVKEEDVDDKEKGEKVKTAGEKDSKGMKRKEDKEPRVGRKK